MQVYLARRGNLVRFFAARTRSSAAAEDLAQELYLKVVTRQRLPEADNPAALLYRMALNLVRDRARGEARASARDANWREVHRATLGGEEIADDAPADEAMASRERLKLLIDAVAGLPPQMRRAFSLHKLEGLTHAQTAEAMGLSVKSVEKHISAALRNLAVKISS